MDTCPICSGMTLRHIVGSRAYWYCPQCRQEVPNLLHCSRPREVERVRARKTV
jgi:tRNA(Ile2) C34 agmatinyltransferase TiaS